MGMLNEEPSIANEDASLFVKKTQVHMATDRWLKYVLIVTGASLLVTGLLIYLY